MTKSIHKAINTSIPYRPGVPHPHQSSLWDSKSQQSLHGIAPSYTGEGMRTDWVTPVLKSHGKTMRNNVKHVHVTRYTDKLSILHPTLSALCLPAGWPQDVHLDRAEAEPTGWPLTQQADVAPYLMVLPLATLFFQVTYSDSIGNWDSNSHLRGKCSNSCEQ